MTTHATHLASRRRSHTDHIVVGVTGWYSGMTATTECGVKIADVKSRTVTKDTVPAGTCKRCLHTLGWDLPAVTR